MGRQLLATLFDARGATIPGSLIPGRGHNQLVLAGFKMSLTSPRDPASHLITGNRIHKPVQLYTPWNHTVPFLYRLKGTPGALSRVQLRCYSRADHGAVPAFVAEFSGATVTNILHHSPLSTLVGSFPRHPVAGSTWEFLEVELTYETITWTWVQGGKSGEDDWWGR